MRVDNLIQYFGEYPSSFPTQADKWSFVFANFHIRYFEPYFWIALGLIPLFYFIFLKIKLKKIPHKRYKPLFLFFIAMIIAGYLIPRLITVIVGALAVRALYGA